MKNKYEIFKGDTEFTVLMSLQDCNRVSVLHWLIENEKIKEEEKDKIIIIKNDVQLLR